MKLPYLSLTALAVFLGISAAAQATPATMKKVEKATASSIIENRAAANNKNRRSSLPISFFVFKKLIAISFSLKKRGSHTFCTEVKIIGIRAAQEAARK